MFHFIRQVTLSIAILAIVVGVYVISQFHLYPNVSLQVFFVSLFGLLLYVYFARTSKTVGISTLITTILLTIMIISLVGGTGWFDSPFSFTLYFLIVILTLFFPVYVSYVLVLSLLGIVIITHGAGDEDVKFLTVLSLLGSIPVSMYVRDAFLRIKEEEKDILILDATHKRYRNNVDKILGNVVHRFGTDVRTQIGIIRQIAHQTAKEKSSRKRDEKLDRLNKAIDRSLDMVSNFEERATGRHLVSHAHTIESDERIRQQLRDSL